MATAGTYLKFPLFQTVETLTYLTNLLLELAESYDWRLEAWAVFPNHYHFMGESEKDGNLKGFIRELHAKSAMEINQMEAHGEERCGFNIGNCELRFIGRFWLD
jgi:REP-associated tyrosine transposase